MNRGCLYWDESSRGTKAGKPDRRGRWCAEKMINGRKVRMRSGDINRCLNFLQEERKGVNLPDEVKPIKGFPSYWIDPNSGKVFRVKRDKVKEISTKPNRRGFRLATLYRDGKGKKINVNRLRFAADRNIKVEDIPQDLNVTETGGELQLIEKITPCAKGFHRWNDEQNRLRVYHLSRKIREGKMLLQAYKTSDFSEVTLYLLQFREELARKLVRRFRISEEKAEFAVEYGFNKLLERLKEGTSHISDLKYGLYGCSMRELSNICRERNIESYRAI